MMSGCALAYWAGWPRLERASVDSARDKLAAKLHRSPSEIRVGRASLRPWLVLELDDISVAELRISHARVRPSLRALLHGSLAPDRVDAEKLALPKASAASASARFSLPHTRAVLEGVALEIDGLPGLPVTIDQVSVEFEGRQPHRFAFTGGRVASGPANLPDWKLAGTAEERSDGWHLRASADGLRLLGRRSPNGELSAHAEFDHLPLHPFSKSALSAGLVVEGATLTGNLQVRRLPTASEWSARGQLGVDGLTVTHHAIARRDVGAIPTAIEGELHFSGHTIASSGLDLRLGAVRLHWTGGYNLHGAFLLLGELPRTSCADVLGAVAPLGGNLESLAVDGEMALAVQLSGSFQDLSQIDLQVAPAIGCRVRNDPESLSQLKQQGLGDGRPLRAASHPTSAWLPLTMLSDAQVRPFVVAEDGAFFKHEGFRPKMIERALAADLAAHRFERGASTITQQLAKNLFLSGERTLSRKLEEAFFTWRLEQLIDKKRILELYLNNAEFSADVYGVAEGAELYFGKEADQLSVDEMTQLAALLPAPSQGMNSAWEERYRALRKRMHMEE